MASSTKDSHVVDLTWAAGWDELQMATTAAFEVAREGMTMLHACVCWEVF